MEGGLKGEGVSYFKGTKERERDFKVSFKGGRERERDVHYWGIKTDLSFHAFRSEIA